MEAKRLLGPLSDETIEEMGEKKHKFHNGHSITSDKTKTRLSWPGAQYAPVKQQTREKTPPKWSGDLEK